MKTASDTLKASLAQCAATLATLWKVTRTDGVVMGFTDHDRDLAYNGITYKAATGFTPSTISGSADLSVDNLDVQSVLSSDDITEEDLIAGLYDGASVHVMLVDYVNLAAGVLKQRRGELGEVTITDLGFTAELRGMMAKFDNNLCELYSSSCRADLGDARCGILLTVWSVTGTVTAVADNGTFTDGARSEADGWFSGGLLTWDSGANAGRQMEIRSFTTGGGFALFMPMAATIAVGDTYSAIAGCDKTFDTCRDKFANHVNFRGEPHIPGNDYLTSPVSA